MADFTPHEAPAKSLSDLPLMHPGKPVGREGVIKEVYENLRQNKAVWLHGKSGAGKTTLAAALASAYAQQSGGVVWLNVKNSTLSELIARIGRAYALDEVASAQTPVSEVGQVREALQQNKPLIVLDGEISEEVGQQFVTQVAPDLPVLIATQADADGSWRSIGLSSFTDANSVVLYKQKGGISNNNFDIDIYGISKLLEYNPFALAISARASAASKQNPKEYYETLEKIGEKVPDGLMLALTTSYRSLNNVLQGLLLIMGASPTGGASSELLTMVSNAPEKDLTQAMTFLSQLFLVEKFQRYGEAYYRVHPQVYEFAQGWLQASNRFDSLQKRFRETIVEYAKKYASPSLVSGDKLASEMDNFVAVAEQAADDGDRNIANQLMTALSQADGFIQKRGYVYELLQLQKAATGTVSAFPAYGSASALSASDDDEDEMSFSPASPGLVQGTAEAQQAVMAQGAGLLDDEDDDIDFDMVEEDDIEESPFEFSTELSELPNLSLEELRTRLSEARLDDNFEAQVATLKAIGNLQTSDGQDTEAISTYNDILNLYEEDGDNEGILDTLDMLAALLVKTDNAQASVMHATRGIKLAEDMGDSITQLSLLSSLGDAHQNLAESEEAISAYSKGLELARNTDDSQNEALFLYNLGYAQLDTDDTDGAVRSWEQALNLFRTQKKRDYEGNVLGGLGSAYSELEQWDKAINAHTGASQIAREQSDYEEESVQLSNLAHALVEANKLSDALLRYRQALYAAYQSDEKENIVTTIIDLVRLMLRSDRLLPISELLIEDALRLDPNDRDATQLEEEVAERKQQAENGGTVFAAVQGSAKDYAANAYQMLG